MTVGISDNEITAGIKLNHDLKLPSVTSVLWINDTIFCACDEHCDSITNDQLDVPKLYRIRSGKIEKQKCLMDTVYNLVDCNINNVFIAISEFEIIVIDTDLHILSKHDHSGSVHATWNSPMKCLYIINTDYLLSWRFRFAQFSLIIQDKFKLPETDNVQDMTSNDNGDIVILFQDVLYFMDCKNMCLTKKEKLHIKSMTCVSNYKSDFWITGSKDGTIKIWNKSNWNLVRSFVSHNGSISQMSTTSDHNGTVSSLSQDGCLFTWSIQTGEILYSNTFHSRCPQARKGLIIAEENQKLVSFDSMGVVQWENNLIYNKLLDVGDDSLTEIIVGYPFLPHEESENRLAVLVGLHKIMVVTNHARVITALYIEEEVKQITYQRIQEVLVICAGGNLYCYGVSDFELQDKPPCLQSEFICGENDSPWVTVTAFSLECEGDVIEQDWQQFVNCRKSKRARLKLQNPILFIAGRENGEISSIDVSNGQILHTVHQPDHELQQIAVGRSHPKMITSSSTGNSYVWRLFPNSRECFNIEKKIKMNQPTNKIIISRNSPIIAINAPLISKYSVHQFSPAMEHGCEYNHRNRITAMDTCEELRFFVTASHDETIKVWDEWNQLILTINLGLPVQCMCITSSGGDLAVSFANSHELFFVKYQDYLPKKYIAKHILESIGKNEKVLLKGNKLVKPLKGSEDEILNSNAFMTKCDRDIEEIKNGESKIAKRSLPSDLQEIVEDEAFDVFMEVFHPNKNIRIPTEADYVTAVSTEPKHALVGKVAKAREPISLPNSTACKENGPVEDDLEPERWVRPNYDFASLPVAENNESQNEVQTLKPPEKEEKKRKRKGPSLMDKMEAAINEEAKKEEEFIKQKEEEEKKEKEHAEELLAIKQSNQIISQNEAKLKDEATRIVKKREESEVRVVVTPKKPDTPPEPIIRTPEPVKLVIVPKPPTPPPSPEWGNLSNYSAHLWYQPLRLYCEKHKLKIRTIDSFLSTIIDLFTDVKETVVQHSLLEAFLELLRDEILDSPKLTSSITQTVQNILCSDQLSQSNPLRKLGINWLILVDPNSAEFAVEIFNWLYYSKSYDVISQLGVLDHDDLLKTELGKWESNVRRMSKRFIQYWLKRLNRTERNSNNNWKDAVMLFIQTEKERLLTAEKTVNNTVMEQTKRSNGALVRIGDLHTGRRYIEKQTFPKQQLPPLELRIQNPGNPKFIRLSVNQKKILLAPLGSFWLDAVESQNVFEMAEKRRLRRQNKSDTSITTTRFQKFFFPRNSYIPNSDG